MGKGSGRERRHAGSDTPARNNTNTSNMEQILEYGTNYPAANGWKRLDLGGIYRLDRYVSPSGRAFNEGRHAATNHDLSEPYSDHAAQIRRQAGTYAPTNKIVNNCSWCYLGASHTMEAHIQAITRPC